VKKRLVTLAFPPVVFCFVWLLVGFGSTTATPKGARQIPQVIEGPGQWVAFSAEVELRLGTAQPSLNGKFYRASNGSTRTELYEPDGSVNMFSIVNMPEQRLYVYDPRNGWRVSQTDARESPETRFSQVALGEKSPTRWEGLEVYEKVQDGELTVCAPELNFKTVYSLFIQAGRTKILRKIKREEPASELFSPPPDVPVRRVVMRRDQMAR
jgi:hypothetical protein